MASARNSKRFSLAAMFLATMFLGVEKGIV